MKIVFIVTAGIVVALVGIFAFAWPTEKGCTLEALVCPDGSAVGRSGPACEFSPCPATHSFRGVLVFESNRYWLSLPQPEEIHGDDQYLLPLEVGQEVEAFINDDVRVEGSFTVGNLYQVKTIVKVSEEETD